MAIACSAASGRRWHARRCGVWPRAGRRLTGELVIGERSLADHAGLAAPQPRITSRCTQRHAPERVTRADTGRCCPRSGRTRRRCVKGGREGPGQDDADIFAFSSITPRLAILLPICLGSATVHLISSPIGCRTIAKVAGRTKRRRSSSNTVCTWQSRRSGTRLEKAKAEFSWTGTYSFRSRERADVPDRPSCRPSGTVSDAHRWHLHPVAGPGVAARLRWPKAEGNGVSHYRPTSNRACRIRDNNGCGCRPPTVATRPTRRARCRPSRRRNGHAVPAAPAARPSRSEPP